MRNTVLRPFSSFYYIRPIFQQFAWITIYISNDRREAVFEFTKQRLDYAITNHIDLPYSQQPIAVETAESFTLITIVTA